MSFNRLDYDACTYQHNLKQSVSVGNYWLSTPVPNCNTCFSTDPRMRTDKRSMAHCSDKRIIDVDSELMGITRKATNCPLRKYLPGSEASTCALQASPDCDTRVNIEDTRLSNPPCTLRGTGWNRWEWLCQNPQNHVEIPFDWNIDNRLVAKDNHRPCIPTPVDQTLALPPGCLDDSLVSYQPPCPPKAANNAPTLSWSKCNTIKQY